MRWPLLLLTPLAILGANQCPALTPGAEERIKSYMAKELMLLPGMDLDIANDEVQPGCYRKLTLYGSGVRTVIYVAPDQRFVTSTVSDTESDPTPAIRVANARRSRLLEADGSPSRGRPDAPVTIVEFADFQCPYCRSFDSWVHALPAELVDNIRIIYRHFPLSIHPWARVAANAAACAQKESMDAFWTLHDALYREQETIRIETLEERALTILSGKLGRSLDDYRNCLVRRGGENLVEKDVASGRSLSVAATPAVFINGARIPSLQSPEALASYIRQALTEYRTAQAAVK